MLKGDRHSESHPDADGHNEIPTTTGWSTAEGSPTDPRERITARTIMIMMMTLRRVTQSQNPTWSPNSSSRTPFHLPDESNGHFSGRGALPQVICCGSGEDHRGGGLIMEHFNAETDA
ncbi:uncharacterized protein Dsimw501_GD28517 [Drosophila simulans]|uniref:Uncharacterized protein n=1 Tax=Drosophila simulans TaxID=7240 RepID=A0A0J9UBN3_DROSI|nr:uncharacterized protein Dsimw501_GD28517 [Drosophila simulans]